MMTELQDRLIARFDTMPPQMQIAARHLIDHPQDIALMSMRDLARRAGVSPATMTRLAQFLGAEGYEDLRREQADTIRRGDGFAALLRNTNAVIALERAAAAKKPRCTAYRHARPASSGGRAEVAS